MSTIFDISKGQELEWAQTQLKANWLKAIKSWYRQRFVPCPFKKTGWRPTKEEIAMSGNATHGPT